MQPAPGIFVEQVRVGLEMRDQRLAMRAALLGLPEGVELELDALQAEIRPQTMAQQDHLGVGIRAGQPERLEPHLMKLTVPALLRALVPEHRPGVPEPARAVVQQVVLDRAAHDAGRALGPQRELLAIERVGEGIHLLFDDVGDLADAAHEEPRVLDDGRADALVAIGAHRGRNGILETGPEGLVGGQHVVHAAHALDAVGAAHAGSRCATP